jgi:hypothetical protein
MYFTALLLSAIGISCAAGAGLFIGKCLRWCDDERWRHPMSGDKFIDGSE